MQNISQNGGDRNPYHITTKKSSIIKRIDEGVNRSQNMTLLKKEREREREVRGFQRATQWIQDIKGIPSSTIEKRSPHHAKHVISHEI